MSEDCIFCKIIEGEIPSHKVYENKKITAFLDANPVSKGHTLVIPKKHVENIHQAQKMDYMWEAITKISDAVKETYNPKGIQIAQNNGEAAGQEVFHMHFHITPVYEDTVLNVEYDRTELKNGEKISQQISENIKKTN